MESEQEWITDSVAWRRSVGQDLDGRLPTFTDSQIRSAVRLVEAATQVARDLGCPG